MVKTRRSAGVDVGLCSGGHWCGKYTKRCHRFTRSGKLVRNSAIQCTAGCYTQKCVNFDVCGVTTASPFSGDFCHLCTYLLACKPISRAAHGSGECPICYERHPEMYTFPMCNRHSSCKQCMRRILFGDIPTCGSANYAQKMWDKISNDDRIITTNQECPICRAKDDRPFLEKFCAMEKNGKRSRANAFAASARDLILQSIKAAMSIPRAEISELGLS